MGNLLSCMSNKSKKSSGVDAASKKVKGELWKKAATKVRLVEGKGAPTSQAVSEDETVAVHTAGAQGAAPKSDVSEDEVVVTIQGVAYKAVPKKDGVTSSDVTSSAEESVKEDKIEVTEAPAPVKAGPPPGKIPKAPPPPPIHPPAKEVHIKPEKGGLAKCGPGRTPCDNQDCVTPTRAIVAMSYVPDYIKPVKTSAAQSKPRQQNQYITPEASRVVNSASPNDVNYVPEYITPVYTPQAQAAGSAAAAHHNKKKQPPKAPPLPRVRPNGKLAYHERRVNEYRIIETRMGQVKCAVPRSTDVPHPPPPPPVSTTPASTGNAKGNVAVNEHTVVATKMGLARCAPPREKTSYPVGNVITPTTTKPVNAAPRKQQVPRPPPPPPVPHVPKTLPTAPKRPINEHKIIATKMGLAKCPPPKVKDHIQDLHITDVGGQRYQRVPIDERDVIDTRVGLAKCPPPVVKDHIQDLYVTDVGGTKTHVSVKEHQIQPTRTQRVANAPIQRREVKQLHLNLVDTVRTAEPEPLVAVIYRYPQ